uniref:CFEM domain-containing protein n=1 Tax=Bionectria ochroleuca TaxID=29856 RepID=A0A8H7NJ48_BIOOC
MPIPLKSHASWLSLLFLSTAVVSASGDALSGLSAYPDCAKPCISSAIQGGICGLDNQACICSSAEFSANVTSCVETKCTIPDSLAVMNISRIDCDETPRDRSIELKVATITVGTVAGLFVMLRFGYKLMISNVALAMDDWLTLATMIVVIPNLIITINGTIPNGLAVIPQFLPQGLPDSRRSTDSVGNLCNNSFMGVGFVFLTIFQCQPISYFWQKWDGLHDGTCLDANTIAWANASSGIALDVWILAIPLLQLRKLQLKWKKKIGVVLMFLVGAFVTIISILRLKSLVTFAMSSNATWDYFDVTMWSIIEISVGIMCACLPTVRLLLWITLETSEYCGNYSPGGASKLGRNSSPKEGLPGIVLQKAYSVHYTEVEDRGSVALSDIGLLRSERDMARKS